MTRTLELEGSSFPAAIGKPATRALAQAGVTTLEHLSRWTEADLRGLHGVGPKAVGILKAMLAERGRAFAPDASRKTR